MIPPATASSDLLASVHGRARSCTRRQVTPSLLSRATKYPDQPTATVDAPNRYSRIRSHPMIHATNSPSVA
jgi:hypothetical protein